MMCQICRSFFPPGFTEPIEGTNFHKCIFCIQGKEKILKHIPGSTEIFWDVKSDIVYEYKKMCNEIANRSDVRKSFLSGIKE